MFDTADRVNVFSVFPIDNFDDLVIKKRKASSFTEASSEKLDVEKRL
jgi:hypothetical protein